MITKIAGSDSRFMSEMELKVMGLHISKPRNLGHMTVYVSNASQGAIRTDGGYMQALQAISKRLAAGLVALSMAGPVLAEQANQSYAVYVSGIKAGAINLSTDVTSNKYAARGVVKATGLLSMVADFGFDGTVRGSLVNNWNAVPVAYEGAHKNRGGARNTVMSFSGNRPSGVKITPPRDSRKYDVDPLAQSGTVDPVTASFMLLRDRPLAQACDQQVEMFDGAKRSRISLGKRQKSDEGWVCNGVYERLAGFSSRELEKQRSFNFTLYLSEQGQQAVVEKFVTQSTAGTVVAVRK